jgi:hypothetical protein
VAAVLLFGAQAETEKHAAAGEQVRPKSQEAILGRETK